MTDYMTTPDRMMDLDVLRRGWMMTETKQISHPWFCSQNTVCNRRHKNYILLHLIASLSLSHHLSCPPFVSMALPLLEVARFHVLQAPSIMTHVLRAPSIMMMTILGRPVVWWLQGHFFALGCNIKIGYKVAWLKSPIRSSHWLCQEKKLRNLTECN
jgi:hypothetical protein